MPIRGDIKDGLLKMILYSTLTEIKVNGENMSCKSVLKHKWIITYDDSPFIRRLFTFAQVVPFDLTYGMRNVTETSDQIGKELFISNYSIKLPQSQRTLENQLAFFEPPVIYSAIEKTELIQFKGNAPFPNEIVKEPELYES